MEAKVIGKKVIMPDACIMEGERKVDKIIFSISSLYNDTDLSRLNAYLNIRRSDGSTDKLSLANTTSLGGVFSVHLEVGESITAVPGQVDAHMSFENENGTIVFMTERFYFEVKPTPNAFKDYTDRAPSALYNLQVTMVNYVNRMQEMVEDIEEKIRILEESESGGSTSGGASYDENNKLSASFIDGLAPVATSGSYNDLSNKPDLSALPQLAEMEAFMAKTARLQTPSIIKYISMDEPMGTIFEKMDYNALILADYAIDGIGVRPLYVYYSKTDLNYEMKSYIDSGSFLYVYFDVEGTNYNITFDKVNKGFSFGT